MEHDDVVTTKEALEMLGVSRRTLYRIIDEGVLEPLPHPPALKQARRLTFRRADVERVLREGRKPPTRDA